MNISLDVPVGQYRHLTKEELEELDRLTGESTKTEEGSMLAKDSEAKPQKAKFTSKKPQNKQPSTPRDKKFRRKDRES